MDLSLTPTGKNLEVIDIFHKKCLKQLLSLPTNVATPVIYLLTGHLPIEGQIDKKVLIFFGNITRQSQENLEKQTVYRQAFVKSVGSNSWVVRIRHLLSKYRLPSIFQLLDQPLSKGEWKKLVDNSVNTYWKESIEKEILLYPSLKLITKSYNPGKTHHIVNLALGSIRETDRIIVKLRIATGCYILSNNSAYSRKIVSSPLCQLCTGREETLEHFLIDCPALSVARDDILESWLASYRDICDRYSLVYNATNIIDVIVDPAILHTKNTGIDHTQLLELEQQSRRLCYKLHVERYKILSS